MEQFIKYFTTLAELKKLSDKGSYREAYELSVETWRNLTIKEEDPELVTIQAGFIGSLMAFAVQAAIKIGKLADALEFGNIELETALQGEGNSYSIARAYNNRGLAFHEMGKLSDAESNYQKGLEVLEKDDNSRNSEIHASLLNNLSLLKNTRGEEAEAYRYFLKTDFQKHSAFFQLPVGKKGILDLNNHGYFALTQGDLDSAGKWFEQGLQLALKLEADSETIGIIYCNLALSERRKGNLQPAIAYLNKAIEMHSKMSDRVEPLAIDLFNLATLYRELRQNDEWLEYLKQAWDLLRNENNTSITVLNVLKELGWARILEKDHKRAFACFKRGMELYEQSRTDISTDEAGHEAFLEAYRKLAQFAMYLSLDGSWTDEVFNLIERAKARFWRERLDQLSRLGAAEQSSYPPNSGAGKQDSLAPIFIDNADDLRSLMGFNGLILNYFTGPDATFVSYCYNRSLGGIRIDISTAELECLIIDFRNDVMSSSRKAGKGDAGKKLSNLLFSKIHVDLDSIRFIYVMPDGPLWYLPFEALPAPSWLKGPQIDKFSRLAPISYLPSVSLLDDLRKIQRQQVKQSGVRFLGVSLTTGFGQYDNLPRTDVEVEAIGQVLPPDVSMQHLKDAMVTKSRFIQTAMTSTHIHIASHAIVDEQNSRPFIVLYGGDKLYPEDLEKLHLTAELVFLSACSTSMGKISLGEGLMSIARAFLWAGVKTVIATRWPVSDRTTPEFVSLFYRLLFTGNPIARALQICRNEYSDKHTDARTWGAFTCFGDADPWEERYSFQHLKIV